MYFIDIWNIRENVNYRVGESHDYDEETTIFSCLNVSNGTTGPPKKIYFACVCLYKLGKNTCLFGTASLDPNSGG